jgi:hypothetical protein
MIRLWHLVLLLCCSLCSATTGVEAAQDIFELEVFEYESTPTGEYEVEFHTNGISRGGTASGSKLANHRPIHMSVEITRGWTSRFETAIFVQTAPFGSTGSARFAGGHLRGKMRIGELSMVPLRMAVSAEYAFNRAAFDHELQTLEVRPILDYAQGRLSLVANPSLELVTHGSDEGLEPVFDLSASAAWQLREGLTLKTDYFSAAATTRHLQPEPSSHHLIFGGAEFDIASRWELGIGVGHCVNSGEPWLMRSVIGYRF